MAYEDLLGVEVFTFCSMSNHFNLLVRVPHRPERFRGVMCPLEVILGRNGAGDWGRSHGVG